MKRPLVLCTLLLAALAAPAHADPFYVGAGYGESFDRVDDPLFDFDDDTFANDDAEGAFNAALELRF